MKQRLSILFALTFGLWVLPALAQDGASQPATSVYTVSDVAVDVTADSAAKARDQAIAEAQRSAFVQLLERLGSDTSVAAKLSNDDLATLVKNFEVRDERASAVRYIGTFAVQFRPLAVRNFLGSKNAKFNDSQGAPFIILAITREGNKVTMWEETTRWQKLWVDASHDGSIVPLIVPTGSPEDKGILNINDAVLGKVEPIKALIDKYKASGAIVAILNGSIDNPAGGFIIDIQHFGSLFDDGSDIEHINLAGNPDKNAEDSLLRNGIKQIRQKIEKEWKNGDKQENAPTTPSTAPASPFTTSYLKPPEQVWTDEVPPARMAVAVQFATLAQWADIQRRLLATPGVKRVDISSVGRGETDIDLGFSGKAEDLQIALAQRGLRLTQDVLSGQWMLKGF